MNLPLEKRSVRREVLSLAPMLDRSNRDWRRVMRLITRRSLLYTEMLTAPAVIRGDRKKLLDFDSSEHPLCLQLAWDLPEELAEAARIGEDWGYDEINLNLGCPSEKVQNHNFGASLMASPKHVAWILRAMTRAVKLPITVKHRIGIRSSKVCLEEYDDLLNFVRILREEGCRKFIVHARIAILEGLSPKENRDIPPLRPQDVFGLKRAFPDLHIEINGGYRDPESVDEVLRKVDGVMLGRIACDQPWFLAEADRRWLGGTEPPPTRRQVLMQALPYLERRAYEGMSLGLLIQPLLNIAAGCPGTKKWKRSLSLLPSQGRKYWAEGLQKALQCLPDKVLDASEG